MEAYSQGIFPWFGEEDEYILWWSPGRRAVAEPGHMRVTRSLNKSIRNAGFEVRADHDFANVVRGCMASRATQSGTWITDDMFEAYCRLHDQGLAHSIETWREGELVGGLYGVSLGLAFFGESMFAKENDASKVAFYALHQLLKAWSFTMIDCQIQNDHLASLGVEEISRSEFLAQLKQNPLAQTKMGNWQLLTGSANLLTYAG